MDSNTENIIRQENAGLYIHIPFCKQKCHYCNFYSLASSKHRSELIAAIANELILQKNFLESRAIQTIYFGGGTPSLLSIDEISLIMDTVYEHYTVLPDAEITLEANPDDLNIIKIRELKNLPINRLSIGIQSFFYEDLNYLNRAHTVKQAEFAIKGAQDAGFENLSIDLIYGIPTLTDEHWKQNIQNAVDFKVPHISAYSLTVEPHTPLEILINKGKMQNVEESDQVKHFEMAMDLLQKENYIHYEISNFCLDNYFSKHNSNYWKGTPYLGIGPSAHSYNGSVRQWNIKNIQEYIANIQKGKVSCESETLDNSTLYNEYVLTRLRTMWGCDELFIVNNFGDDFLKHFKNSVSKHVGAASVIHKNGVFTLSDKGKLFADAITADLFF